MKARILWLALAVVIGGVLSYVAAQNSNTSTAKSTAKQQSVTVELMNGQGQSVGTAMLTSMANNKGVRIKLDLKNLSPGQHGIHFHEMAKCEGPNFESAGAH